MRILIEIKSNYFNLMLIEAINKQHLKQVTTFHRAWYAHVQYRIFVIRNSNYKSTLTSETEVELRNVLATYVDTSIQPRLIYDIAVFRTRNLPNTSL
jgi:hypothetical protein